MEIKSNELSFIFNFPNKVLFLKTVLKNYSQKKTNLKTLQTCPFFFLEINYLNEIFG